MSPEGDPRARSDPPRRPFEADHASWLAIDAWRSAGGLGLCYLVRLQNGAPTEDDREDRRATLESNQHLDDLEGATLDALLVAGVSLTATERRITDTLGDLWLVRNTGPVWAEGGVAEGATGALFRCLTRGDRDPEARTAGHLQGESQADLVRLLGEVEADP